MRTAVSNWSDNPNYEPCKCSFCVAWAEKTGQVGYVLKKS